MSTVPRRAGGTPFFRHVHLKAGIEVPRARLLYMNEERCAPAAPREERGPGAPLAASAARSWPCGVQAHIIRRRRGTPLPGTRYYVASYASLKTRIPSRRFFGPEPVLSHRDAACAGARLSFLLAGVEAASPRTYNC